MRPLTISFGQLDKAAITAVKAMPWQVLAKALTDTPPETSDKASRGWYIPATFDAPHRHGDTYVHRDAITFDFDHVNLDTWGNVINALDGLAFCLYTTFSHTYDAPRFRCVIPLSRPMGEDEFEACARQLAKKIGIDLVARESFTPPQMMYLPTRRLGGEHASHISESDKFLGVDEVLAEYTDWTDRSSWPRRADDLSPGTGERSDPREKPGVVGEFCRKFNVIEAIQRFDLPYKHTNNPNRYTYAQGSVAEGVVIYDEGNKLHSHHDSDPCRGQHNSYDLVRLTRFGHLDAGGLQGTGPADWPSSRAMADFVRSLPEFASKAADEFTDLSLQSAVTEEVIVDANGRATERFIVRTADEFGSGPPVDWVVRGVLPRAELAVVYGESGSGKSFLALDLCAAITRGIGWRERRTAKGKVVYVCAEGAGGFKARLRAYARGHDISLGELPAVIADAPNLLEAKDTAALCHSIVKWGKPDVIVIDTLSATAPGGNENSGEDMGRVLSHCKFLHRQTGALVVLIHHSGKDATKGARGWSGLRAAADAEIEVTRNGDFRAATVTKMKDGSDGEQWPFKLKVVELGADLEGEIESSCVVEHTDETAPVSSRKTQRKGLPKLVYDTLAVMAPSGSCDVEDLVEGVKTKLPKKDGKDRRRAEIIQVITRQLIPAGDVHMQGEGRISLTNIIQQADSEEWLN